MLRHNACPHHRHRGRGFRKETPPHAAAHASRLLLRHRPDRSRRHHPPAHRRRANQRNRIASLQEPDRGREVGGGNRHRPPPSPQRRAHHRCLLTVDRPRRDGRHRALLRKIDPQSACADHDRHHRSQGHRTLAHLLPGQEHHQLGEPRRRRREIRAHLPGSQSLRRSAGSRLH